jgi:methylated-DNA-[protein]-cysteine S-methyltransferase
MTESEFVLQGDGSSHRVSEGTPAAAPDYAAIVTTPWDDVGLGVCVRDDCLVSIDFLPGNVLSYVAAVAVAREAVGQLQAYFRDPRHRFTVPLAFAGTSFQRKVWETLRRIPAGNTRSYGEVARQLGSSARAVGSACRANPIAVVIPCHRIVSAQGLGGFMGVTKGRGLEIKQCLLAHESDSACRR